MQTVELQQKPGNARDPGLHSNKIQQVKKIKIYLQKMVVYYLSACCHKIKPFHSWCTQNMQYYETGGGCWVLYCVGETDCQRDETALELLEKVQVRS